MSFPDSFSSPASFHNVASTTSFGIWRPVSEHVAFLDSSEQRLSISSSPDLNFGHDCSSVLCLHQRMKTHYSSYQTHQTLCAVIICDLCASFCISGDKEARPSFSPTSPLRHASTWSMSDVLLAGTGTCGRVVACGGRSKLKLVGIVNVSSKNPPVKSPAPTIASCVSL